MNARFRQFSSFPPLPYVYLCAFIFSLQSSPQARVTQPLPHPLPAAGVEYRVRLQRRRRTLLLLLCAHNARHSARDIKRRQPWPCCDCWCRSKRANLQYCVQVCPGVLHVEERRHVHGVAAFHEHAVRNQTDNSVLFPPEALQVHWLCGRLRGPPQVNNCNSLWNPRFPLHEPASHALQSLRYPPAAVHGDVWSTQRRCNRNSSYAGRITPGVGGC